MNIQLLALAALNPTTVRALSLAAQQHHERELWVASLLPFGIRQEDVYAFDEECIAYAQTTLHQNSAVLDLLRSITRQYVLQNGKLPESVDVLLAWETFQWIAR